MTSNSREIRPDASRPTNAGEDAYSPIDLSEDIEKEITRRTKAANARYKDGIELTELEWELLNIQDFQTFLRQGKKGKKLSAEDKKRCMQKVQEANVFIRQEIESILLDEWRIKQTSRVATSIPPLTVSNPSPHSDSSNSPSTSTDYVSGAISVAETSSIEQVTKNTQSPPPNAEVVNVPPIYISKEYNGDITTVNSQFNQQFSTNFICKVTKNGIKVTFTSNIDRANYVQLLLRNEIRINDTVIETPASKKFVIKGIDHRVRPEIINEELERLGFRAVSVKNMISTRTKKPLPIFEVDLQTSSTLPKVTDITVIAFFEVSIEEYRRRRSRKQPSRKSPALPSPSPSEQVVSQPTQAISDSTPQTSCENLNPVSTPQQMMTRAKAKSLNQSKTKSKSSFKKTTSRKDVSRKEAIVLTDILNYISNAQPVDIQRISEVIQEKLPPDISIRAE